MSTQTENRPDAHEHASQNKDSCCGSHEQATEPTQRDGCCGGHAHQHELKQAGHCRGGDAAPTA